MTDTPTQPPANPAPSVLPKPEILFHKDYPVNPAYAENAGLPGAIAFFFLTGPALVGVYLYRFSEPGGYSDVEWYLFWPAAVVVVALHIFLFGKIFQRTRHYRLSLTVENCGDHRLLTMEQRNGAKLLQRRQWSSTHGPLVEAQDPEYEYERVIEQIVRPQSNGRERILSDSSLPYSMHPITAYDLGAIVRAMNKDPHAGPPARYIPPAPFPTTATPAALKQAPASVDPRPASVDPRLATVSTPPPDADTALTQPPTVLFSRNYTTENSALSFAVGGFVATGFFCLLPILTRFSNALAGDPQTGGGDTGALIYLLKLLIVISAFISLWVSVYRWKSGRRLRLEVCDVAGVRYLDIHQFRRGRRHSAERLIPAREVSVQPPQPEASSEQHPRTRQDYHFRLEELDNPITYSRKLLLDLRANPYNLFGIPRSDLHQIAAALNYGGNYTIPHAAGEPRSTPLPMPPASPPENPQ